MKFGCNFSSYISKLGFKVSQMAVDLSIVTVSY